ncbi:MAG TPA: lipoprotein insertase outer membrane protein LolB [Nevskiaceae bacterium]
MKHPARRLALLAASLLMAGCAAVAPTGTPLSTAGAALTQRWQAHERQLSALTAFTLDARVAASGSFGVTGAMHWVEDNGRFAVHFAGPFGSNAVDIVGDRFVVNIRSGDQHYVTSDPEHFLLEHFGWTLPLRGLQYWARGLPAPAASAAAPTKLSLNGNGQLLTLDQAGWRITYLDYQQAGPYMLPHRLNMEGQRTQFRIVIDTWQPGRGAP